MRSLVVVLCCLFQRASTVPLRRADWQVETVVRLLLFCCSAEFFRLAHWLLRSLLRSLRLL